MQVDPADLKGELTFANQASGGWDDFWQRFGGAPDLHGKTILDFGCNRGGSVHRALREGAARAVGVDINPYTTEWGREKLQRQWGERAQILCGDIMAMAPDPSDIIISTNTMEHVSDIAGTLRALVAACRPGGELFIGFSPLWFSPYGNHGYPPSRIPWYHLLRGDGVVLDDLARHLDWRYDTVQEAGFNCATPDQFRTALAGLDVEILSARRNVGRSPLRTLVSQSILALSVIPALEKYVTVGFFWHLRRKPAQKESSS